jgi:hypothetical protein
MEPENWATDPVEAVSRLARLIREIDASDELDQKGLLEVFLSASWGCRRALDQ